MIKKWNSERNDYSNVNKEGLQAKIYVTTNPHGREPCQLAMLKGMGKMSLVLL